MQAPAKWAQRLDRYSTARFVRLSQVVHVLPDEAGPGRDKGEANGGLPVEVADKEGGLAKSQTYHQPRSLGPNEEIGRLEARQVAGALTSRSASASHARVRSSIAASYSPRIGQRLFRRLKQGRMPMESCCAAASAESVPTSRQ